MGRVRINRAKLHAALSEISDQAAARAAARYREKLREEIMLSGRINTGEMMQNITIERNYANSVGEARWTVKANAPHFKFQNDGTKGSTAGPGKVLRFKPKGSGVFIFRKRSGPIEAANYLKKTSQRMRPSDWT